MEKLKMPVNDAFGIIPLQCPYCKTPMRLTCGNSGFSHWSCRICNKEFEFHIQTERFTNEINKQSPLPEYPVGWANFFKHFLVKFKYYEKV